MVSTILAVQMLSSIFAGILGQLEGGVCGEDAMLRVWRLGSFLVILGLLSQCLVARVTSKGYDAKTTSSARLETKNDPPKQLFNYTKSELMFL